VTGSTQATALIAAAGSGERLGAGGPKALARLGGRAMVEWSVEAVGAAERVGAVLVAAPPESAAELAALLPPAVAVVEGGESRSDSVAAMLERADTEAVVVHDAARPLVTPALIDAVLERLRESPEWAGVVAAARLTDTVKEAGGEGEVERTLDRSRLWAAQTPQAFRAAALREALADPAARAEATDDAMLVERAGGRVLLHEAPRENLKVTTPLDLRVAELLLAERR
jgi:2-C-methyl-D-erythritol 4-phosphate cytidylyltransferase